MGSSKTGGKDDSDTDIGDSKTDQQSDSDIFTEGEKVLAFHGPCLYEAKVQKIELSKKDQQYYVHYLGWNKNWDEWMEKDRLLKWTDSNLQMQNSLKQKQGGEKNPKTGRLAQSKPKSSTEAIADKEDIRNYVDTSTVNDVDKWIAAHKLEEWALKLPSQKRSDLREHADLFPYTPSEIGFNPDLKGKKPQRKIAEMTGKSKKRKVESGMEEKDTVSPDKHVKIQIPTTLKKQLLDDCEFVTQLGKLVKLPRAPCVDDILKKYMDYKSKKDAIIAESIAEILKGLRCYFDKALPVMLLYKKELPQYHEAIADNISPSAVYGAEHLLRLFVKLPEILTSANIDEETLTQLLHSLHEFLKFLQKNQSSFFLSTYDVSQVVEAGLNAEDD